MSQSGHHLAIYNFGVHTETYLTASVQGFSLREALNFDAADRAIGYVGRSGYADEPGPPSWGEQVFPRFLKAGQTGVVSSLSLWLDIESLMAFTYAGVHAEALKHARHWNQKQAWPPLVLFWVPVDKRPEWKDGVERLEMLADQGIGPHCFTFREPFDPDGKPAVVDRALVKQFAAENAAAQADLLDAVLKLPV